MDKNNCLKACLLIALAGLPLGWQTSGGELARNVLAQADESGGFRANTQRAVRILNDGKIEKLDQNTWTELGRLSETAVSRLKQVTDAMTSKSKLATKDSGTADAPSISYFVKNKEGDAVLIGKKGLQESILMQGGASSIIEALDGLRALAWISY